jgi:hypothetical protein
LRARAGNGTVGAVTRPDLQPRSFAELWNGPFRTTGRLVPAVVHPSVPVAMGALRAGAHMLSHMPVRQEPAGSDWAAESYHSVAACRFELRDVLVHSGSGILALDDAVISDTLDHTDPAADGYETGPEGVVLHTRGRETVLRGTHLALLAGNTGNYWHWTVECLARLSIAGCSPWSSVLVPGGAVPFRGQGLDLAGVPASLRRPVGSGEAVRVEHLVVPWTVVGQHVPHPCMEPFFRAMADRVDPADTPRLIYVDRRGPGHRRLVNEDALVAELARRGFVPVRLETLPLAAQIRLFRGARCIVSPHGAGLANLVFARPGCRVLELFMDDWVNWTMRRLAALFGLSYDCVIGRALPTGPQRTGYQDWTVSVMHVLAALDAMD